MKEVAHHLQKEAKIRYARGDECDTFARAAYNRYYYAVFLCARETMATIDRKWARLPHASLPETLEVSVVKIFQAERQRALKNDDSQLSTICQRAIAAAKNLAKLMRNGSAIRIIADYQPEVRVTFEDVQRFSLQGIDITSVHQWPTQAEVLTTAIKEAWRQINV